MNVFQKRAVAAALRKVFSDSHFDFLTVQQCFDLANVKLDDNVEQTLRLLHTVPFAKMHRDLREEVFHIVVNALENDGLDNSMLDNLDKSGTVVSIKKNTR